VNAAEHIDRAEADIARGRTQDATAHALIAIAELMAINVSEAYGTAVIAGVEAGAMATAEAFGEINKIFGSGQ
jgi:hypothetical protein